MQMQDNFFVVGAVLKDQYGVTMSEDSSMRACCAACRHGNMVLVLQQGIM